MVVHKLLDEEKDSMAYRTWKDDTRDQLER